MRPCACATSSLITPNVTQFEPRLCVFPSALFFCPSYLFSFRVKPRLPLWQAALELYCVATWSLLFRSNAVLCIMFDLWDKYQAFVTRCICQDWKVSPFTALKQRRCMATVLYRVLFEELCILGTFCLLKKEKFHNFGICFTAFLRWDLFCLFTHC